MRFAIVTVVEAPDAETAFNTVADRAGEETVYVSDPRRVPDVDEYGALDLTMECVGYGRIKARRHEDGWDDL